MNLRSENKLRIKKVTWQFKHLEIKIRKFFILKMSFFCLHYKRSIIELKLKKKLPWFEMFSLLFLILQKIKNCSFYYKDLITNQSFFEKALNSNFAYEINVVKHDVSWEKFT